MGIRVIEYPKVPKREHSSCWAGIRKVTLGLQMWAAVSKLGRITKPPVRAELGKETGRKENDSPRGMPTL